MGSRLDSTSLFMDQVRQHEEALNEALSSGHPGSDQVGVLMEKCIRCTRMLAGSVLIMGLDGWHECLNALERLFARYRDCSLQWDEKIAQVVSEIIEKEELLLSAHEDDGSVDLVLLVPAEEMQALTEEINVVLDTEHPETTDQETTNKMVNPTVAEAASPLAITQLALERAVGSLGKSLSGASWGSSGFFNGKFRDIHKSLCLVDFYARSMKEILALPERGQGTSALTILEPIQNALEDYASILCLGQGRKVTVVLTGADNELDTNLLFTVGKALQYLIRDIVLRCDDSELHIEVDVTENNGVLWWTLCDDGNNFIKDSKFDREEILAFYPSLKQVRKTMEELNSILWVEPEGSQQARFVFTTPIHKERKKFMVWGDKDNRFGVLSTQLCSVLSRESVPIESNSRGEYLLIDDHEVPLVGLQLVYSDAPEAGERIAVIGSLENKIAIYVNGNGSVEEGIWHMNAVSRWKGLPRGVAELDEVRIPVVEASDLIVRFLKTSGEPIEHGISGGVAGDGNDLLPESQATFTEDSSSPPELNDEEEREVLVIEQSKAVKEAFEALISDAKFNMQIVESVEEAIQVIRSGSVRLIISEFRMPTLAAQKIKTLLVEEGKDIPVIVTTAHSGDNADLLVQKLGVSGYLSKPLTADAVSSKVDQYLCANGVVDR
ncbi:MAG: response regulator [Candidatus Latescibacterota bacterium]